MLKNKPVMARDAPGRLGKGGPFVNPDPDFVVARVGQHHVPKLNMHCVYRPAFVLHTKLFALQTDDLDCSDIAAGMAVMAKLELTLGPQMTIYNCGVDAGSSQGHKHMQVFPLPADLPLYPQKATSANGKWTNPLLMSFSSVRCLGSSICIRQTLDAMLLVLTRRSL